MTYADRLREAMSESTLLGTPSSLARAAGISSQAISLVLHGGSKSFNSNNNDKVARALGVSPSWLATGTGNKRPRGLLDPALWNTEVGPDIQRSVPLISWVQAGTFHEAADPFPVGEAESWIDCPKKTGSHTYALRVRGDSMTSSHGKSYPEGCVIFVDPERRSPVTGERIIAKLDGAPEVTFKVFVQDAGKTWLKPLNAQYPIITEPFKVLGTVIGKWEDE